MKTRKGYKVYPLTSAQKLHFYCLKYCPKKQVLNIGSSLTIQVDLDWEVLKSCIKEAIARCDTMRLRFTHDKEGNIYNVFGEFFGTQEDPSHRLTLSEYMNMRNNNSLGGIVCESFIHLTVLAEDGPIQLNTEVNSIGFGTNAGSNQAG